MPPLLIAFTAVFVLCSPFYRISVCLPGDVTLHTNGGPNLTLIVKWWWPLFPSILHLLFGYSFSQREMELSLPHVETASSLFDVKRPSGDCDLSPVSLWLAPSVVCFTQLCFPLTSHLVPTAARVFPPETRSVATSEMLLFWKMNSNSSIGVPDCYSWERTNRQADRHGLSVCLKARTLI